MLETISETADFIETRLEKSISTALILGSGRGGLTQQLRARQRIPYAAIPHFPQTTVQGHRGYLYYGTLEGVEVLILEGRFHYYEGYLMRQVTFPVRVLHALGVQNLIVSNAGGGVNPTFKVRDLMLITDHINLFPKHPLRSQNEDRLGPRFVDLHQAYNWKFIEAMRATAEKLNISLQTGVYVGTQGSTYETPSEHRARGDRSQSHGDEGARTFRDYRPGRRGSPAHLPRRSAASRAGGV